MKRTPPRVQPRLFWIAVFSGLLITGSQLQAGGAGEPGGPAGGGGGGGAAAAGGGGGRAGGGERSSAPVEGARAVQSAPAARAITSVRSGAPERVAIANQGLAVANQGVARGNENVATVARASGGNGGATAHYALHYGNPWTDPPGTGQRQRGYSTPLVNNQRGGSRHGNRGYRPFLYQFYGGYYPIYVDAPYGGGYYDGDGLADSGYDGGPAVVPDPGAGPGTVIPPSSITVSPQNDGPQPGADPNASGADPNAAGNGNGNANPDMTQGAEHTPNPAIGPDSLVEAVQAELTRRGYFQGKVDAMFRADTEAALRRFQQDNYLAPTGHLNEPTLHALNLD